MALGVRRVETALAESDQGLSLGEIEVLHIVRMADERGDSLGPREVAERRQTRMTATFDALKSLSERGLIRRREWQEWEKGDRRQKPLTLTTAGKAAHIEARKFVERIQL